MISWYHKELEMGDKAYMLCENWRGGGGEKRKEKKKQHIILSEGPSVA